MTTATVTEAASAAPAAPYRWRWLVLAIVLAAEIMDLLDSTVVNIAAPTIRKDLGGTYTTIQDRKSTRLNSSHLVISYAVFCLKKKKKHAIHDRLATERHE